MRTEKEIIERANKLKSYLEIAEGLGKLTLKEICAIRRELRILEWVLGEEVIEKKDRINIDPTADHIIEILRDAPDGLDAISINLKIGKEYNNTSNTRALLRSMVIKGKLKMEKVAGERQIYKLNI